jgi:hypothetical protein
MLPMVGIVYSFHYSALDHLHGRRKTPPEEVNQSRRKRRRPFLAISNFDPLPV